MFGKMSGNSPSATPNHLASVAAYWSTDVLGSKRHGSMGPTVASFVQESDAQKFVAQLFSLGLGGAGLSGRRVRDARFFCERHPV